MSHLNTGIACAVLFTLIVSRPIVSVFAAVNVIA